MLLDTPTEYKFGKKGRKWNFVVILKQQQHEKKNEKKLECDGHSKGSTSEKIELKKMSQIEGAPV